MSVLHGVLTIVEPSNFREAGAADRTAPRPERRRVRVALPVHEVMEEVPVLGDHPRRPGRRVVGAEHGAELGVFRERRVHAADRVRRDRDIGIDEEQDLAAGRCGPAVPGSGRARVLLETDRAGPREPGDCRGVIRGGVVDDDELTAGYGGGFQRGQTFGEVRRVVVDGNDDGQANGALGHQGDYRQV
jgi:hypothetical protein